MPDLLFLLTAVHNIPVLWSHSIECWKYLLNMFSLKKIHKVIGTLPQWHNLHVKMPLICFFLPLLESPPAPYNPNASYPRSSAADLLINNCMGKPRNIRIQFSPYNLPWVCTKKPWQGRGTAVAGVCQRTREKRGSNCPWLTPSRILCLSFLLCGWNVAVLSLSPQPGIPPAFHQPYLQPWNPEHAIRSPTLNLLRGFEPKKKKKWLLPHLRLIWVVFFYIISELSKQFRTQNLTWGLFLPHKIFTIDGEAFLYHIAIVKK